MAEIDVLVPEDGEVTTITGEKVTFPPLSWGREVKVLRIIKDVMTKLADADVFKIDFEVDEEGNTKIKDGQETQLISKITGVLLDTATDSLTGAVAAITGKDNKWVEENLDAERILAILVPTLRSKRDSLGVLLQKYLGTPDQPETK